MDLEGGNNVMAAMNVEEMSNNSSQNGSQVLLSFAVPLDMYEAADCVKIVSSHFVTLMLVALVVICVSLMCLLLVEVGKRVHTAVTGSTKRRPPAMSRNADITDSRLQLRPLSPTELNHADESVVYHHAKEEVVLATIHNPPSRNGQSKDGTP